MLALELLAWWYGRGWARLARSIGGEVHAIVQLFSVPILMRTMFAPWKRLVSAGTGGIQDRMRGALDNTVSRLVGFMVRSVVLIAAGLLIGLVIVIGGLAIIVWPLVPLASLVLIVKGFV